MKHNFKKALAVIVLTVILLATYLLYIMPHVITFVKNFTPSLYLGVAILIPITLAYAAIVGILILIIIEKLRNNGV